MNEIIKEIEAAQLKENVPVFNVGDTVKVYGKIKEGNRERIQVFEGTVIKKHGGSSKSKRIGKIVQNTGTNTKVLVPLLFSVVQYTGKEKEPWRKEKG